MWAVVTTEVLGFPELTGNNPLPCFLGTGTTGGAAVGSVNILEGFTSV